MRNYCDHLGAVPYTGVTAMLRYCHHCQAWHVSVWCATWADDEHRELHYDHQAEGGPFLSSGDVATEMITHIAHAMCAPGCPWDPPHVDVRPMGREWGPERKN